MKKNAKQEKRENETKQESKQEKKERVFPKAKAPEPKPEPNVEKKEEKQESFNDLGHRLSAQSGKIDEVIKKRMGKIKKMEEMDVSVLVKETGLSKARIASHLNHLKNVHQTIS
jgi:hypothetical protein